MVLSTKIRTGKLLKGSMLFLLAALVGCASSPLGRNQLILVSDAEMDKMGAATFQAMSEEQQASDSGGNFDYVRCIADAILVADGRDPRKWEVKVFDTRLSTFSI